MSVLYLYAVAAAPPAGSSLPALGEGLAGEPLRAVPCGGVLALVGELTAPPPLAAAALAGQNATVRRLADLLPALLPVRFGEHAAGEAELAERLAPRAEELRGALERVAGCVQMTLRVFRTAASQPGTEAAAGDPAGHHPPRAHPPEAAAPPPARPVPHVGTNAAARTRPDAGLPDEPPDAAQAAAGLAAAAGSDSESPGPGTRYLAARRQALERARAVPEIAPLRAALAPLLRAERAERVEPPATASGTPDGRGAASAASPAAVDAGEAAERGRKAGLIATVYHLIGRGAVDAYGAALAAQSRRLAGVRVAASGPWPPYAFTPEGAAREVPLPVPEAR